MAIGVYTDNQLLTYVGSLSNFKGFPKGKFLIGLQSEDDAFNLFDDKGYAYDENQNFLGVGSMTTNAGIVGLKRFFKYNKKGCFVLKSNWWHYDMWRPGFHKGEMQALVQNKPVHHYRDWNKNNKVEEYGPEYIGMCGINFHTVIYNVFKNFVRKYIGGWSTGCQVMNNVEKYYKFIDYFWYQPTTSYVLIKEKDLKEFIKNYNLK